MRTTDNIYKSSRKASKLSQETACEVVSISARSLARYESGESIPPDDVVMRMSEAYSDNYLPYLHLQSNPLYSAIFPSVERESLPAATIRVLNSITEMGDKIGLIYKLAAGEISDEQRVEISKLLEKALKNTISVKVHYQGLLDDK